VPKIFVMSLARAFVATEKSDFLASFFSLLIISSNRSPARQLLAGLNVVPLQNQILSLLQTLSVEA
jgi:hypothetical protein